MATTPPSSSPSSSPSLQWTAVGSLQGNQGNPGTPGQTGTRGTQWILGQRPYVAANYPNAMVGDIYMDTTSGSYGQLAASSASNA